MQQRVALARSLAIEPSVLLLDEPLSALDAKVRVQLREEIRRIQLELGITTIYVTHDQEEALSISDRVAVMYGGKIEQVGPPSDMYGAPETPFVAEFIGTMNRLEGTVLDDVGGIDHGGTRLTIDSARGRSKGERVLVLVRPESLKVEALDGRAPAANELAGDILSHTFLGPVTRLKVVGPAADLIADVSTAHAGSLPVGSKVVAQVPTGDTRLLSLEGVEVGADSRGGRTGRRNDRRARSGRSVKIPVTPSAASSSIRASSFDGVDGRLEAEPSRRGQSARA